MSDRMRDALSRLAESEREGLTVAERDAVRRVIAAHGAALVRRARLVRRATAAGIVVVAAAAALTLAVHPWAPSARTASSGPPRTTPDRVAAPRAPACDSFTDPRAEFVRGPHGGARLDLGAVALAVLAPGGDARVSTLTRCDTSLALVRGTLDVHARRLGGGRLLVATPRGNVVVHGTVLRIVVEDGDAVVVAVVEGAVTVVRGGVVIARVAAGTQVRLDGEVAAPTPLDDEQAASVRSALGLAAETAPSGPAAVADVAAVRATSPTTPRAGATSGSATVHATEPSTETLLADAEDARRRGDLDGARSLYRRAGAREGRSAEAAWLGLARLELRAQRPSAAHDALAERDRLFAGHGALGAEAAWLDVQADEAAGDRVAALAAARSLVTRFPASPQAAAARVRFSMQAP